MQNSKIKGQHIVCLLCFLKAFLDVFVHAPGLFGCASCNILCHQADWNHDCTLCVRSVDMQKPLCAFQTFTVVSDDADITADTTDKLSELHSYDNTRAALHVSSTHMFCRCSRGRCHWPSLCDAPSMQCTDPAAKHTHTHTHTQEQERHFKEPGKCSDITCTGLVTDGLVLTSHAWI